jgi:hypothetical protein
MKNSGASTPAFAHCGVRSAAIEIVHRQALHDCAGLRAIAEGGNHPEAIAEDVFELRSQRVDAHCSMLTVRGFPFMDDRQPSTGKR